MSDSAEFVKQHFQELVQEYLEQGLSANDAAVQALTEIQNLSGNQQPKTNDSTPPQPPKEVPMDIVEKKPPSVSLSKLKKLIKEAEASSNYTPVIRTVGQVFCDPEKVSELFKPEKGDSLVHMSDVDQIFSDISCLSSEGVQNSMTHALKQLGSRLEISSQSDHSTNVERLRPFLVALRHPGVQYGDPDLHSTMFSLCKGLYYLNEQVKDAFVAWLKRQPSDYFESLLASLQMFITIYMLTKVSHITFKDVFAPVIVLDLLYQVNEEEHFVEFEEFYNEAVSEKATENNQFLLHDYSAWRGGVSTADRQMNAENLSGKRSFCQFPFILDPGSKARILQIEAIVTQREEFHQAMRSRIIGGQNSSPYVLFKVRREHLVDDALDIIGQIAPTDLKKPLKVQFVGEEGVDEGGVQKEFFLLMTRKLLDLSFGMFSMNETSRLLWFNEYSFEEPLKFELVGLLMGLAIYNSIILDVNFPLVLYRKLLGTKPTLDDLIELRPEVGLGLQKLLSYQPASDVEDVFGLLFQINTEFFGEIKTIDLKPDGGNIAVTGENRQEYVDLYVEQHMTKLVEKQFNAFDKGFHMVCGGEPLKLFKPQELQLLICGSSVLDFENLEKSAQYEDYTAEDEIIQNFWSIVHEFGEIEKKKLLMFMTGSDRVPIRGLESLKITISRNGSDSDRLPTAHTCFNHLLLPAYATKEKLEDRLKIAIENAEGFGTM